MRGIPIPNRKIEEEKAHLSTSSEVVTYKLSPEEIEEKFAGIGQAKWSKPIDLQYGCPEKNKNSNKEGNEVSDKLTTEMVKQEIKNGLGIKEICNKYNKDKRVVIRMFGMAKKQLEATYEEQEEKMIIPEVEVKEESTLKLITRQTDFQGEELKYRIQNEYISILNGGTGVKIELCKLSKLIQELQEINEFIKEA